MDAENISREELFRLKRGEYDSGCLDALGVRHVHAFLVVLCLTAEAIGVGSSRRNLETEAGWSFRAGSSARPYLTGPGATIN